MAVVPSGGQNFEKPDAGIYLARIIDVFNRGLVQPTNPAYKPQVRVRLFWVLFDPNRPDYKQKDGSLFRHMKEMPWKMTPPTKYKASTMYDVARGVFGAANIPANFDDELFLGRANQIVLTVSGQNGEYREVTSILPVPKNFETLVPAIPTGYIRIKNRPQQGQQGQTVTSGQASNAVSPTQQFDGPEVADEDIPF